MSQQLFTLNSKLTAAISLINDIDKARFPLLLTRVIKKFDTKNAKIFTPTEEAQLLEVLGLSQSELSNVLEACTFIFEQSTYYSISPTTLVNQLEKTGLVPPKIEVFQKVWQEEAESLIGRLRTKSVAPYVLDSVGWRLHLHMSQSSLSRVKTPTAIFRLDLKSDGNSDEKNEKDNNSGVTFEFTKDELEALYLQLEKIQDQLDSLG